MAVKQKKKKKKNLAGNEEEREIIDKIKEYINNYNFVNKKRLINDYYVFSKINDYVINNVKRNSKSKLKLTLEKLFI